MVVFLVPITFEHFVIAICVITWISNLIYFG